MNHITYYLSCQRNFLTDLDALKVRVIIGLKII